MGILQALRGDLTTARATWQRGLTLYSECAQIERLYRTLYTVALGQVDEGIATLQAIIQREKPPKGLLRQVLEIARLLERCPESIEGISHAIFMLEWGIEHAPVFQLKPKEAN